MTTLTLTRDQLGQLRKGDKVTAIDGRAVEYTVAAKLAPIHHGGPLAVALHLAGRVEPVNLYPDTHMADVVTVERKEPRTVLRHFGDLTLVKHGDRDWRSEDGRWQIAYEEAGVSDCHSPHPISAGRGRTGGYCPGHESHYYSMWCGGLVGNKDDVLLYGDTLAEVANALADHLRKS